MYINIGEEYVLKEKDIIAVFDMDKATVGKITRDYLNTAQKSGKIIYAGYDLPKSFIVTKDKVYISPLNTATVLKRAQR
jgi:regulator of extracellular matrix RemA (YlzA/DUF370 family)